MLALSSLRAQTPKENLEKAVEIYNANRVFQEALRPATITDEEVGTVKSRINQGITLLDKVIREGNSEQIRVARYFKTNFYYSLFYTHGVKGNNAEAYEINKKFESDITRYSSADFPMSYDFFDKKYNIKWEDFSATQAEYYTGYAEVSYNMGKYADAVRIGRLAMDHPGVSPFLKYISVNKILDASEKQPSVLSESERLNFHVQAIQLYDSQNEAGKKLILENKYPTTKMSATALVAATLTDKSPAMLIRCATAAPIAAKYDNSKDLAIQLFQHCYLNNYAGSESFHTAALELARTSFPTVSANYRRSTQEVGDAALTALVAKTGSTECDKMKQYAADYKAIGLASKGQSLEKQFTACVKNREEAARRQEAERRRQVRRANRNFNVYLGVDVVPLLTSVEKMDFGGHLDLMGRRVAHSFGYAVVNQRKDYNSNRTQWDGNRYFYTFKIFSKKDDQPSYSGLYFGYAEKTFETLTNISASSEDGVPVYFPELTPVDKQYEVMWNSGMQALGRPFGVDIWFGIGASYNQLSFKEFENPEGFTFDNDDFFDNRGKLESIQLKMRMGISVGLNFGKKRK